jgi:hypothetical protein
MYSVPLRLLVSKYTQGSLLISLLRHTNDIYFYFVIPAKAGIQSLNNPCAAETKLTALLISPLDTGHDGYVYWYDD